MKRLFLLCLFSSILFIFSGCSVDPETVEISKLDTMEVSVEDSNLEQELSVEGEPFKLLCSYDTGNYNLNTWRITDSKTVSMSVKTKDLPEDMEVLIEHVHCDINIKSTLAAVDGLHQDSMDDEYHGVSQDGFYIDNETIYKNIFAIEGYSETLFKGWGYICGEYGSLSLTEERLTEKNLILEGKAYAQKMQIVYDLSIKNKDDDKYHTVSVSSEFLIPLNTKKYEDVNKEE